MCEPRAELSLLKLCRVATEEDRRSINKVSSNEIEVRIILDKEIQRQRNLNYSRLNLSPTNPWPTFPEIKSKCWNTGGVGDKS